MTRNILQMIVSAGSILMTYGLITSELFSSEFSRAFIGTPSENAPWVAMSGLGIVIIGLLGILREFKRHRN